MRRQDIALAVAFSIMCAVMLLIGFGAIIETIIEQPSSNNQVEYIVEQEKLDPPESQIEEFDTQLFCLAENVYFEARSEPPVGQLAVIFVTLNRTRDPRYPSSICGVVKDSKLDKNNNVLPFKCQFSWYCDRKKDIISEPDEFEKIMLLCKKILQARIDVYDFTVGATHYHHKDISPYWIESAEYIMTIDNHVFYRMPV